MNKHVANWLLTHDESFVQKENEGETFIVSLTSFPGRIDYVWLAIKSLMFQSYKPNKVILYLSKEEFPNDAIPESLKRLQKYGLEIHYCDNLMSHKKYFYAFQEYPNANIITIDDDLFQAPDMIRKIVRLHKKFPKDIIASSVQLISPDICSLPSQWEALPNYRNNRSSFMLQAFTGAGTLFPPDTFDKRCFDKETAMEIAATTDDLWLKANSLVCGKKTTGFNRYRAFPIEIEIKNNSTLFSVNRPQGENKNDICWLKLVDKFGLTSSNFN